MSVVLGWLVHKKLQLDMQCCFERYHLDLTDKVHDLIQLCVNFSKLPAPGPCRLVTIK